ncbi:MAG: Zn-ribbon domain-containing OB-fold protein [Promethearchaeota archaeon]
MSKLTQRKSLNYIKKDYVRTRTMPANWYLASYKFKFNISHASHFLKKLTGCNRVFFPPRLVCGKCLVKPDHWVDLRETGRVATFAIVYLKDPETGEIQEKPTVLVQQDGADTCIMSPLNPEINFKDAYVGMPVKVHWAENRIGGLMDIEYYDVLEDDAADLNKSKE